MDRTTICPLHLDEAKVELFKNAIQRSYWLEFFIGTICIMFYSSESVVLSQLWALFIVMLLVLTKFFEW